MIKPEFETLKLQGFLTVSKTFLDGRVEKVFEEENLVVNGGKLIAIRQIYPSSGVGDPLSYAKVGTGGYDGIFPKAVNVAMTDIFTPALVCPIAKIAEDSGVPSVTLVANVDNSQGNGLSLNEAGFFSTSGVMFNIKVFPAVPKNSSFSLNLQWVIKIS